MMLAILVFSTVFAVTDSGRTASGALRWASWGVATPVLSDSAGVSGSAISGLVPAAAGPVAGPSPRGLPAPPFGCAMGSENGCGECVDQYDFDRIHHRVLAIVVAQEDERRASLADSVQPWCVQADAVG